MVEPVVEGSFQTHLILLIISLILCMVFSFLETSITAIRLFKLKEITKGASKYRGFLKVFEESPNRILISVLIAYNMVSVLTAVSSNEVMTAITRYFAVSETIGFTVGIILTSLMILLTDLIPKNIAAVHGERLFSSTLWITSFIYWLFRIPVAVLSRFADIITHWFGGSAGDVGDAMASEKEIQFMLNYINEKGLMEGDKVSMLKSIFELGTTPIKEVMVPEMSIVSISIDSTQKETLAAFAERQFSRLPVYEGQPGNVIGMVHQKDLFLLMSRGENRPLRDIVRPIIFFPEMTKVLRVLKDFREQRMHMAMVLNEFGSITGLVTLEDVIEEIVGEISDEYEQVPEKVTLLKTGGYLIDARIGLDELVPLLGIEFETEGSLSLGGFLIERFERVPLVGESLEYKAFHFKVQQATPKRIVQVLVYARPFEEELEV